MLRKSLLMFVLGVVASACGVVDPAPIDTTSTAGAFAIGVDSVEISGPGQARIGIDIADTTKPTIISPAPFPAPVEVTGSIVKRTVRAIDARGPATGSADLEQSR